MKKVKYFIFSLICLFSCNMVFAENEVVIKSITPVYDENSGVVVTNENNQHGVIFNDRDQSVKYKVVIENTTNNDLQVTEQNISSVGAGSSYEVEGLKVEDVVKANSTEEIVISLNSGTPESGWEGRNFEDTWTAKFGFVGTGSSNIINPNTGTGAVIIVILICVFLISCAFIVIYRKKKITRYVVILLAFGSVVTVTSAEEFFVLPIKINVSYESQNVMKKAYSLDASGNPVFEEYWKYKEQIRRIYIETDPIYHTDLGDSYYQKFDVSEKQNERVYAYIILGKENLSYLDVYLQSDGVIYANPDASYYFYNMQNLDFVEGFEYLDTSNVTNMNSMFGFTSRYASDTPFNFSGFDTSNVTNMNQMFRSFGTYSTNMKLNLGNFDTSNVTNMNEMFYGAGQYAQNVVIDLNSFNTSKVTDMSYMFSNVGAINTSITIRNPNTTQYDGMFYQAAVKTGSQITVNYTSETSDLVDQMIKTKENSESNVVKGEQVE